MANQLPDFLQGYQGSHLAEDMRGAISSFAPPSISIEGNRFSLVDPSGDSEALTTVDPQIGFYMDAIVVDGNKFKSRIFYAHKYDPSNPQPPACFSHDSIVPSASSPNRQAPTCAACPNAVIGSATGFKGGPTSACRHYIAVTVLLPQYPDELRLLRIPPNSFKNWAACLDKLNQTHVAIETVIIRFYFEQGVQGTLRMQPVSYQQDKTVFDATIKLIGSPTANLLLGRGEQPAITSVNVVAAGGGSQPYPAADKITIQSGGPSTQAQVSFQQPAPSPAAPAPEQPRRRRRNTAQATPEQPAAPQQAPFRPGAPPPQGNANFGMTGSVAPNAEVQAAVDSLFK